MATDKDIAALQKIYEMAISARNFEINQLVQRNNFFMIFQGVLLAGLAQASSDENPAPVVMFLVCVSGFLVSILQIGMSAGAKFWQERWEYAVETTETKLIEMLTETGERSHLYYLYSSGDEHMESAVRKRVRNRPLSLLIGMRFSPSRIPIYVAMSLASVWALLLCSAIDNPLYVPQWIRGFR